MDVNDHIIWDCPNPFPPFEYFQLVNKWRYSNYFKFISGYIQEIILFSYNLHASLKKKIKKMLRNAEDTTYPTPDLNIVDLLIQRWYPSPFH